MEYEIKNHKNVVVFKLSQPVTVYQLQEFKDAFQTLKGKLSQKKNVLMDLKKVSFLDPLALGVMVAFSKDLRENGGDLKILHMSNGVKQVFDESRLSKVYEVYDNMDDAVKSFS